MSPHPQTQPPLKTSPRHSPFKQSADEARGLKPIVLTVGACEDLAHLVTEFVPKDSAKAMSPAHQPDTEGLLSNCLLVVSLLL